MRIQNNTQNTILSSNAILAKSFFERARGLLGKSKLEDNEALIIPQCPSIHMFFMKFAIDVIFADKACNVVGLVKNIKPFSLSTFFPRGYFAIELKAGTIDASGTKIGDVLSFEE
ncbi:MAG: DUF192 domain-containing protein [Candidatus Omnitrophica bacterium]|nr:DUF192 domain-containing protein [Candidatus Omnitrophota bacterium]